MGNRSSSSPYSPHHTLPYGKRAPPAAYIEPYVDFPPRNSFNHPPPQVFMNRRLGGSRLSLNAVPVDTPIIIPDLKTLKKLEKMDKKQRKIMKVHCSLLIKSLDSFRNLVLLRCLSHHISCHRLPDIHPHHVFTTHELFLSTTCKGEKRRLTAGSVPR